MSVKGIYYFLPQESLIHQRSGLGGFWWEGKPFQTGNLATLPTPPPVWRSGAMNLPVTHPCHTPCNACFPSRSYDITSARFEYHPLTGPVVVLPISLFIPSSGDATGGYAGGAPPLPPWDAVSCQITEDPPHYWTYSGNVSGNVTYGSLVVRDPPPGPDYAYSYYFPAVLGASLVPMMAGGSVYMDWFGTPRPGC